jgi:hypothetical protein
MKSGGCDLIVVIVVIDVEVIRIVNGLTIAWVVGVRLPVRCGFVMSLAITRRHSPILAITRNQLPVPRYIMPMAQRQGSECADCLGNRRLERRLSLRRMPRSVLSMAAASCSSSA